MAEEFHESDVIFSDNFVSEDPLFGYRENFGGRNVKNTNDSNRRKKRWPDRTTEFSGSAPVNIPETLYRNNMEKSVSEEYSDGGEIIPPHVIVGRRVQGKMALSVCTGKGRTLKGRDLSRVRNSVLRMTGFLEA